MASKQEIAVVVDIGTTEIVGVAGQMNVNNRIEILGLAKVASRGIKRGVVLNIDEFSGALNELISRLEQQFDGRIGQVDVALAGQSVQTFDFKGVRYTGETGLVTQQDIDYLLNEARNMPLEYGHKIYHIFPQNYIIDEEPDISVPVGHAGRKIEAFYKLITAPVSYRANVEKALAKMGVELGEFMISPVATAESVLSADEREAGVVLVDLGGGTTKMSVFYEGNLCHAAVIPFAGDVITRDIKEGCSILLRSAEQLKVQFGQAMGDFAEEDKVVTIPGQNGWEPKEISFKSLAYIIQARLEEIVDSIYFQIEKSGYLNRLAQGIVLTGGTANLSNLVQLVKYRTGMDARIGFSLVKLAGKQTEWEKPDYITAFGLLKKSLEEGSSRERPAVKNGSRSGRKGSGKGIFSALGEKVSQQISIMFNDDDSSM